MSDPKGQHEPSMEEILASIRRIIAEDGDTAAAPAAVVEKPQRGEEVLELTEVVEEDGTVVSISAGNKKPAVEPAPPPPRAMFDVEAAAPPRAEPEPPPPPPPAPPPPAPPPPSFESDDERLVSERTASASISALSQLSALGARDQLGSMPLGDAGRTLEDLVRELLRPMLRDWLDANLPQLVERLVQEEIRRMSREAQSR
jgi:cell pole-organizing protein PopZ